MIRFHTILNVFTVFAVVIMLSGNSDLQAAGEARLEVTVLDETGSVVLPCRAWIAAGGKRFFQAEKEKRSQGLKHLKAEATKPVGTEEPEEPDTLSAETPDVQLDARTLELAEEEGISYEMAQKKVLAKDVKLAAAIREFWDNPTR